MKMKYLLAASVVSLSTAGLMATPAAAQQITSGVEGQVRDESGNPLPGGNCGCYRYADRFIPDAIVERIRQF